MSPSQVACPQCGASVDRTALWCPSCGSGTPGRSGAERNAALARQAEETIGRQAEVAMHSWLMSVRDDDLPAVLVRSYQGRTQSFAAAILSGEARALAKRGYQVASQSWMDGRAGLGRVLAIGLYANVIRPDGVLSVTFQRQAARPATVAATKKCPDCAELVLADARICRFCRHDFTFA